MAKRNHPKSGKKGGIKTVKPAQILPANTFPIKYMGILFAFSFLLYANTFSHEFTQDDAIVITDNMYTQQGVAGIPGLLTKDTFFGFFKKEGKAKLVSGGRYRPLTPVMFALEYQVFGKNPMVGHILNAVYYGITVVVLFLLLFLLFQQRGGAKEALFIAMGASLLFAAHPLHTEAVANIKGRDEIMALLGSLLALYLSLRAYFEKKEILSILAGLVFFLGLMAKENTITFMAIVPMTFYFFTKANLSKIAKQMLPFLIGAIVFLIIRHTILGSSLGEPSGELMNNPYLKLVDGQWINFSVSEKLATIMFTLGKYIQLLIFPHPLTHDYYPYQVGIQNWGNWPVITSFLLYAGLAGVMIAGFRKKKIVAYGIAFYLVTLSIVSNIVFPVGTNMSERFVFMPSVGFSIIVAYLLYTFTKKAAPNIFWIGLGAIILLFSIKTVDRNRVWKDNFTLFTTDIKVSKNSIKLQNAVGGALSTKASSEKNPQQKAVMLNKAVGHLNKAITMHPTYKNAYLIRGNCYNGLKAYDKSIADYKKALQLDSAYEDAEKNLAITYREAGKYYGEEKGNLTKAIQYLNEAYQMTPADYTVIHLLGVAHGMGGNSAEAIKYFTKGTQVDPQNAFAWFDLGIAYLNIGDTAQGNAFINKARQLDPEIDKKRGNSQ